MIKVTCPVCQKRVEGESLANLPSFPFCSPRCKTIDLGRWLGERYRVPAEADETAEVREEDVP